MDTEKVVEAVNFLIQSDNYTRLINEMTEIIEQWDQHPMAYDGNLKCLNALIDVGLESRDAFENLVSLIERKRKSIPVIKRVDYQRNLMRERRARFAKALELHELRAGKKFKNATERNKVVAKLRKKWAEERAAFIADKGNLSWKERNTVSGQFWDQLDNQLDKELRSARKK
jgi:chemotaxis protein histidine kinase CheA